MNTKDWPRFVRDCPLETGTVRAVLEALAHFADGDGRVRVSRATLSLRAGCSEKSVSRAIKELSEDIGRLGLLRVQEAGKGAGRVSVYQLALDHVGPIGQAVQAAKGAIRAGAGKALMEAKLTGKPLTLEAGLGVFAALRRALEAEAAFDTLAIVEGFERIFAARARRQVEDEIVRWSAHLRAVEKAGQSTPEALGEIVEKRDTLSRFLGVIKRDSVSEKRDNLSRNSGAYKDTPTESPSRAEAGASAGAGQREAPATAAGVVSAWLRELGDYRTPEYLDGAEFGLAGDRLVVAQPSAFSRSRLEAGSGLGPVCRRLGLARVKLVERMEGRAIGPFEMQARLDGVVIGVDLGVPEGDLAGEWHVGGPVTGTAEDLPVVVSTEQEMSLKRYAALSATHREAEGAAGGQPEEGPKGGSPEHDPCEARSADTGSSQGDLT